MAHPIWLTVFLLLSGCETLGIDHYGEQGLDREAFAAYVERIFRLQNQMSSHIMLMEPDELTNLPELSAAEERMREQCAPLNRYAIQLSAGESTGLWLRRQVERSTNACERAALTVKHLLQSDQR